MTSRSQVRNVDRLRVLSWNPNDTENESVSSSSDIELPDLPDQESPAPADTPADIPDIAIPDIPAIPAIPALYATSSSPADSVPVADDDLYMDESGTNEGDNDDEDDEDDDLYIVRSLAVNSAILIMPLLQASEQAVRVSREPRPLTLLEYLEDLDPPSESDDDTLLRVPSPSPTSEPPIYGLNQSHGSVQAHSPLPSSPSPPSPTPSYEIVKVQGAKGPMPPPLHLALGLWVEKSACSRADYVRLREVLQLSKASTEGEAVELNPSTVDTLPLKLDTLKRQLRRHIPLLQVMRKPLPVVIEKQPSLPHQEKGMDRQRIERLSWQYWYDPVNLIRTILSASRLRKKMFFGMAHYVDEPTELWESRAWGSSIRTTSGDVCYTQDGALIIPGDLVRLAALSSPPYRIGRVVFIGRDLRTDTRTYGEVVVTLQAVASHRHSDILSKFTLNFDDSSEYYGLEDVLLEVTIDVIIRHVDIYLDRELDDLAYPDERKFIRKVLNVHSLSTRPLYQLHQTRGELEVAYFGRQHLEKLCAEPHTSFPYLLFIDDFGVHRNMYRALKAFYLIPANLDYSERRKIANVFTLTLGPHGAKFSDVVEAFVRPIQQLDHGLQVDINGKTESVCAFAMTLLGDMPQQADNGGFMRHKADRGCRTCFCPKESRGDLDFNIIKNGRYHAETVLLRGEAEDYSTSDQAAVTKDTGIRLESPPVAKLCPALDLIQARAYDAPHSEWRGLGRILQSYLMTNILSKRGGTMYLRAFQNYRFPPGWQRIQSPVFYIWSWSLSEAGKATLLAPLILRTHASVSWFRLPFLHAIEKKIIGIPPMRAIIRAFGLIALSNTLVGSQRYTDPAVLHQHVLEARKAYQDLITCAKVTPAGFDNQIGDDDEGDDPDAIDGEDDRVLEDVLSEAAQSDLEDDISWLQQPIVRTVNAKGKGKAKEGKGKGKGRGKGGKDGKFERLLKLPNVHAGLHLAENAREYATVMNSNVLAGELKHKCSLTLHDF